MYWMLITACFSKEHRDDFVKAVTFVVAIVLTGFFAGVNFIEHPSENYSEVSARPDLRTPLQAEYCDRCCV